LQVAEEQTAPVLGLRYTGVGLGGAAALVKLNIFIRVPALASKDPVPMRALPRKTSSMKRGMEACSVRVLSM
jgi:hypothetical protein